MVKIEVLDPIESRIPTSQFPQIENALSFPATYWRRGQWGRVEEEYQKKFYLRKSKDGWIYFLTGLLPRIQDYCALYNIEIKVEECTQEELILTLPRGVGDILFRPHQVILCRDCGNNRRGTILSPTATGKTVMQAGLISMFPHGTKVLLLAHTLSIVSQTYNKFKNDYKFNNVQMLGGGLDKELWGDIVVGTRQTVAIMDGHQTYFDVVIVDEGHHVKMVESQYGTILCEMMAPYRYAFTATEPKKLEEKLALEGLIGPTIGELTMEEAIDQNLIAKPKVKIIKFDYNRLIHAEKTYPEVYRVGLIENTFKNRRIIKVTDQYISEGKKVLIMIVNVQHGKNLLEIARNLFKMKCEFVWGDVDWEKRDRIKDNLQNGGLDCVISNVVWREGVDIPAIDVVINAGGGEDANQTKQLVGRGLRRTKTKDSVIIVDFFDPSHHYLIKHFGSRFSLYCDEGWV
jgi:superfamily II DNA or RNA helicase